MKRAIEQIRRMRGGAQSHLMRCDDGDYYIVKFQNNPQGVRILANELLVPHLEHRVPVEGFTEPGDAFKLDYGYRDGVRGFVHAVAIGRDPVQPKVLAYTAGRVRMRYADTEFTAITETEPNLDNRRHAFIARLFENNRISIVPLNRVEKFAEELRVRLQ